MQFFLTNAFVLFIAASRLVLTVLRQAQNEEIIRNYETNGKKRWREIAFMRIGKWLVAAHWRIGIKSDNQTFEQQTSFARFHIKEDQKNTRSSMYRFYSVELAEKMEKKHTQHSNEKRLLFAPRIHIVKISCANGHVMITAIQLGTELHLAFLTFANN